MKPVFMHHQWSTDYCSIVISIKNINQVPSEYDTVIAILDEAPTPITIYAIVLHKWPTQGLRCSRADLRTALLKWISHRQSIHPEHYHSFGISLSACPPSETIHMFWLHNGKSEKSASFCRQATTLELPIRTVGRIRQTVRILKILSLSRCDIPDCKQTEYRKYSWSASGLAYRSEFCLKLPATVFLSARWISFEPVR
jgi:hypothetical protein